MTSDEDMIKFHNGDTLDSIPVIRDVSPAPTRITAKQQAWAVVLGSALVAGLVVGLVLAAMDDSKAASRVAAMKPVTSVSPAPSVPVIPPTPTVTATATATVTARSTVVVQNPYSEPETEQVYVVSAPATGGDPGVDYCFSYNDSGAVLMVNAPHSMCQDFLFSTHPNDGMGVFESEAPDCSATPGARSAELTFDPSSSWGGSVLYTCLLANN